MPARRAGGTDTSGGSRRGGATVTDTWSDRAEVYRTSRAHSEGADLDLLVEWSAGARTAIDVATGGGHVARRLREAGVQVVTVDPARGMQPDVVSRAEELPFEDHVFDVAVTRVAGHHFEDVRAATRELARVSADRVLVVDTLFQGEAGEEAEKLRDPSHVRNYSEEEWRSFLEGAGLDVEEIRTFEMPIDFDEWLARTGCTGEDAERARDLLADRIDDGMLRMTRIALRARVPR
ncbi:MAG: methyltransferase domain-containing protein [Actinobacteria bacterium]|nr:methyltransferase domain-containing protein [Actinomycetota bacterium]